MALYAIGDLHLSLTANKSMEVFGQAWYNYVARIKESLSKLNEDDVLILAGDISWGIDLNEAEADFRFLDELPGQKYIIKGNHDYWWTTVTKFNKFCQEKGFTTLHLIHNNCIFYGDYAICGTRGWFYEEDQKHHDAKILHREVMRLETSLQAAGGKDILCFLHYPPMYQCYECPEILETLKKYPVKLCCYGHLHGYTIARRMEGELDGIQYFLISADHLKFVPKKICD